ncbi:hypothetical protein [Albidovulum salinarum]|uniref:hypothetical protein n=1 Tax=Albidovulum salinarum TaxID=2984153 RepID=UPI0039898E04
MVFAQSLPGRHTRFEIVETLQAEIDAWIVHYNTERLHLGCGNMGGRTQETVMSVNGGVKSCHSGGAKVGQLWACALERAAPIRQARSNAHWPSGQFFEVLNGVE